MPIKKLAAKTLGLPIQKSIEKNIATADSEISSQQL
jgi:hypothetical protein